MSKYGVVCLGDAFARWCCRCCYRHEHPRSSRSAEQNREELLELYKSQYQAAWQKFLPGVVIREFVSPAQALSALTRLTNTQDSPIKLLKG